jgi:hypothetical protein
MNSWIECLVDGHWTRLDAKVSIYDERSNAMVDRRLVPPGHYRARRATIVIDDELQYDELAFGYTVDRTQTTD